MPRSRTEAKGKWTRGKQRAAITALALGAVGLALVYFFHTTLIDRRATSPAAVLEPGWQFYTRPTSAEPPGTIFRIDNQGLRFLVTEIKPQITMGTEAFGTQSLAVRTNARMLARFVGGRGEGVAGQQAERLETLEFEMFDVQKEVTTDMAILELLAEFRSRVDYRRDNRYFVIRESRSAVALKYLLSKELINSLQGTAGLAQLVKSNGGLSYEERGSYVLNQKLPARMRVMFLAEELIPAKGMSGGKPQFETARVT